ncbi:preprotein translocase subunit YajC [Maricaulis sp.]|jgi:preprotein translocase subunit YajC|uniref:preprotein translocase subunit YajC n=1 Tax=Maricaulis sp. TaxID=1486257 RepID=UPI00260D5C19|nr:preprotein translocase subunit YajC [Maricaulis sp.]
MNAEIMNMIVMFGLMIAVFYFLIIRPQQKRQKEHTSMLEALKKGDEVVTQGGLIGKVAKVADAEVTLDLGDGVKVKVVKQTVIDVRGRTEPKPANDAAN